MAQDILTYSPILQLENNFCNIKAVSVKIIWALPIKTQSTSLSNKFKRFIKVIEHKSFMLH